MPAIPLQPILLHTYHTYATSMLLYGAVAFCQWQNIMRCDIYWRTYCIWTWLMVLRASWGREGCWIPTTNCISGRLRNYHREVTPQTKPVAFKLGSEFKYCQSPGKNVPKILGDWGGYQKKITMGSISCLPLPHEKANSVPQSHTVLRRDLEGRLEP